MNDQIFIHVLGWSITCFRVEHYMFFDTCIRAKFLRLLYYVIYHNTYYYIYILLFVECLFVLATVNCLSECSVYAFLS